MTATTPDRQQSYGAQPVESEQGLLLTVLMMVLLGVVGVFLVS
ncbi:hypothetical protein SAMN05444365_1025 [Micromonospora pattaloongensis]|uniref:Uncharacterized protein n=1 Tax=Micromonospora pattaloongensis TaxID=405436 RepID=A0A1H3J927_9ACTN|nr:hypothetical protein [Micromonospora pattaloongensis]SDY36416.1 hypothetical protein SAMN05444365_1025 [Micromonospora pattaloongensis]